MSRIKAKTIDQVEQEQNKPADKRKEVKEFQVVRDPNGLYSIKYSAGGEVPDELKGKFTTVARAQVAIDNELALRKQKDQNK